MQLIGTSRWNIQTIQHAHLIMLIMIHIKCGNKFFSQYKTFKLSLIERVVVYDNIMNIN